MLAGGQGGDGGDGAVGADGETGMDSLQTRCIEQSHDSCFKAALRRSSAIIRAVAEHGRVALKLAGFARRPGHPGRGRNLAALTLRPFPETLLSNVDGRVRLTGEDTVLLPHDRGRDPKHGGDLMLAKRIELLTHRCFVRIDRPSDAIWPFDDTYAEPALGPDSIWQL